MSTQQDIYAAGSENRLPMLNNDNYVPWSSRLLRYAKSKPNGQLLVNSIKNGPYVRRMIIEPVDPNSVPLVAESSHEQTDDEVTEKEAKQIESCHLDYPYGSSRRHLCCCIQLSDSSGDLVNEWENLKSTEGESIESYYHHFSKLMNDFSKEKHFPEKIASNLKFLNNLQLEWN
ncbi:hypothetical protein Tco_1477304 [Tanacetum coccineum]